MWAAVGADNLRLTARFRALGLGNPAVPAFILEKDHPQNGGCLLSKPQSSNDGGQRLEKAKAVGPARARMPGRTSINFLHH